MEDNEIIELYWRRSEQAIQESSSKYGSYCLSVANRILSNLQDSEECVSSTWLNAWNAIPPQRPNRLSAFFAKITRNLSINKLKARTAEKRSGNEVTVAIDELDECLSASDNVEAEYQRKELSEQISRFLHTLPERECNMGAAQEIATYVDAVLMLLRDRVVDKQRQEQQRANRCEARVVHFAAVPRRVLGVLNFIRAPGGGDICERSFHARVG